MSKRRVLGKSRASQSIFSREAKYEDSAAHAQEREARELGTLFDIASYVSAYKGGFYKDAMRARAKEFYEGFTRIPFHKAFMNCNLLAFALPCHLSSQPTL